MRDAVLLAERQIPAVALVTEEFWPQGDFVARAVGMPDVPRVQLPHPVAGSGHQAMAIVAEKIQHEIISALGIAS